MSVKVSLLYTIVRLQLYGCEFFWWVLNDNTVESIFNSSNHRKRPLSMPKGSKQWGGTGVQPVPRFWRSRWGYYLRPKTPVWSSSLSNTSFGGYQWVKCRCRSWPSPESSEAWGDTSRGPVSLPWNWREGPSGKSKPFSINCRELETLCDMSFWHCHDKLAIIMTIEWKCNPILIHISCAKAVWYKL